MKNFFTTNILKMVKKDKKKGIYDIFILKGK